MTMLCPNEKIEMKPVKVESHYGQSVLLDQCPECGGIWFDQAELYMAKQGQAVQIESVEPELLRSPCTIENAELTCPKDGAKLLRFVDPFFPKDFIVLRCPYCEGFWLNRGEFTKYQKFRQEKLQKAVTVVNDKEFDQKIEEILEEHQTGGGAVTTLGNLGRFLSTPMDESTNKPLEPGALSPKEQGTMNVILNLLPIILRLFLRI